MNNPTPGLRPCAVLLALWCLVPAIAGAAAADDGDADGVPDRVDNCPQSPAGAITDAQGCALDGDLDGVADGVDRCPRTPFNVRADVSGCAKDERTLAVSGPPPSAALVPPAPAVAPVVDEPAANPAAGTPSPPAAVALVPAAAFAKRGVPIAQTLPAAEPAKGLAPAPAPAPPAPAVVADAVDDKAEPLTVPFDPGSAELSRTGRRAFESGIGELRTALEHRAQASLLVTGHAATGPDGAHAARLSFERADTLRGVLVDSGIPEHRIQILVAGVTQPLDGDREPERNCRAEIALQPQGAALAAAAAPRVVSAAAGPSSSILKGPAVSARVDFEPYSSALDGPARSALQEYAQAVRDTLDRNPASRVALYASADRAETGLPAARLAESRAAAVRAYLLVSGLPGDRVEVIPGPAGAGGRSAVLRMSMPAP